VIARYWIAKYVDDPFRNETRNVGVIVSLGGNTAARFVGERDDGQFDGRKVKGFAFPEVYSQWRDYWREAVDAARIDEIVASPTANFFVVFGGEVSDVGDGDARAVGAFLFSLLVSEGGIAEAFQWGDEEEIEASLSDEISQALKESHILGDDGTLLAAHPVQRGRLVQGHRVPHTPSFSQENGSLYVMEHIDLSSRKRKTVQERAGWMAYMFSDIKDAHPGAVSYSIVRPARDDAAGSVSYARQMLDGASNIVDWANSAQRREFVQERTRIAVSLG
jgi:hypothetical protein